MRTQRFGWLAAGLVWLMAGTATAASEVYTIDAAHTTVAFAVRHLGLADVPGSLSDVSGTIIYDAEDVTRSSVNVVIQAASISTQHAKRDEHLRSADFLDVASFPDITFKSTRIEPYGDHWMCFGTFTLHGVTNEVAIPFQVLGTVQDPSGKERLVVQGEFTIDRQDYGVSWSKTLDGGGLVVGNKVKITLTVEAVKEPPASP